MFLDNDELFSVLLDTGAAISVFTDELEVFKTYFAEAKYSGYDTLIGGFGERVQDVQCILYLA